MNFGEARRRGLKVYLSSSPCINGHPPGYRKVVDRKCIMCDREKSNRYYWRNREEILAYERAKRAAKKAYLDACALGANDALASKEASSI